jgi:DNA-binding IclR family transcriptional regulator
LLAWVARVRDEGFADGPSAEGAIWSLAAPLPSEGFSVPLVLGLSGPVKRIRADLTHLGSLLTTTITGMLLA